MTFIEPTTKKDHWYTLDGESRHDADLRQARKQGLFPSVTSVLQIKSKPGLDRWKRNEAILAALTLPRIDSESEDDFAKRVAIDMDSHSASAAKIGTALHDWAENYCNGTSKGFVPGYQDACWKLQEWIDENIDSGISEASLISLEYGFAGRVDWQGRLKDGRHAIIDFKTQGIKTAKPTFYPEWCYQLAAYAEGKDIALISVAIGTIPDKQIVQSYEWTEEEKIAGWQIFKHCLAIWKLERGYDPLKFLAAKNQPDLVDAYAV